MPYITHPLYTVTNKQTAGRGVGAGPEADWTLAETSQFVVESRGNADVWLSAYQSCTHSARW